MSGACFQKMMRNVSVAGAVLLGASAAFANDNGTPMTAGVVVDEMPIRERTSYVMGIIDALAYARFAKDTAQAGENDQSGMQCVYNWFHDDGVQSMTRVDAAFREYRDYPPSMVVAAMVKKACGE